MKWRKLKRRGKIEDVRGQRMGPGRRVPALGGGLGIILLLVLALVFKVPVNQLLDSGLIQSGSTLEAPQNGPAPEQDEIGEFISLIKGSTDEVWEQLFRDQQLGGAYRSPKFRRYSGMTRMESGGVAQAATGPFYLPAEERIYLDTSFFDQMDSLMKGLGRSDNDFAYAYVIAHEVGHHVQHLLGLTTKVHSQRGRIPDREFNKLSVRLELMADYLAGVWAHHADKLVSGGLLDEGDVEEAMRAATAIGDDRLQRQSRGQVVPDTFTHGTSKQRVRWFMKGLKSGQVREGNTFQLRYDEL